MCADLDALNLYKRSYGRLGTFSELVEHYETAAKTLAFCFETLEVCNARIIAADELIKKYKEDNEEFFDE